MTSSSVPRLYRSGFRHWWPGERIPESSDAELAYRPIDPSLIASFKHALSMELGQKSVVEYLKSNGPDPLATAQTVPIPVSVPGLSSLPRTVLADLTHPAFLAGRDHGTRFGFDG